MTPAYVSGWGAVRPLRLSRVEISEQPQTESRLPGDRGGGVTRVTPTTVDSETQRTGGPPTPTLRTGSGGPDALRASVRRRGVS